MKKIFGTVLAIVCVILSSCGGPGSSLPKIGSVDIQMLSNEAELTKVYEAFKYVTGENIKKMDEVKFYVSSPSIEKGRENREDDFNLKVYYLNPKDKNKLFHVSYHSEVGWQEFVTNVELHHDADAESFVLEEQMFDMSSFTAEKLFKIVQDALAKYKNDEKYSVQYVKNIEIKDDVVKVTIYSRLASNNIEQVFYYKAGFNGVAQ